ncbi:MAG: multidrug/spermidine efflux SMR transporter subunit MdtI [Desulfovibrionaceae bacterium]
MDTIYAFINWYVLAVLLSALLDTAANLLLARSEGFKRKILGFSALAMVGLAFVVLSFSVRGLDLAVAYAMWGGFGILGTSLGGWLLFGQRIKTSGWAGIVLLIGGMTMLHAS